MKKLQKNLSFDAFKIARLTQNLSYIKGGAKNRDTIDDTNTGGPKTNSSLVCINVTTKLTDRC